MKYKPFENIKEIMQKKFNQEPFHSDLEPESDEIDPDERVKYQSY